uniref:Tetratricopeptide repeat protein n=1 Tax=Acidobacterium capsulatum TaxID=33075 RepID=A0A7V4XQD8_9BACT
MRKSLKVVAAVAVAGLLLPAPKAHAVSKEIIQLQVQVQALQNAVQHLQQTDAEQMGAIQNIVQQTSNTVIQMNQTISALQNQLQAQQQSGGGAIQQVSTQIQSLNDSVDELRTRIEKLSHQMDQVESQLQNVQQPAAAPGSAANPNGPSAGQGQGQGQTAPADSGNGAPQPQAAMQQPAFPPIRQLYQVAFSDYEGGRYKLAASEFGDVVKDYPLDDLSGRAQFYIGEANYHLHNYRAAIKAYEAVLQNFAGNSKAPASRLHKAYAELALGEHEAGVRDLKALIARYPQTPEASQARVRLHGLGISGRHHSSASRGM